jgi:hypothetical protein
VLRVGERERKREEEALAGCGNVSREGALHGLLKHEMHERRR